jgi:hypothetical protein
LGVLLANSGYAAVGQDILAVQLDYKIKGFNSNEALIPVSKTVDSTVD